MDKLIDLHTHSTASDGTDSPSELVEKAARIGLGAIALTDHDTIDGLDEAEEAARDNNIEFIRGCEFSVKTGYGNLHILGLWLPAKSGLIDNFLSELKESRQARNRKMLLKLQNAGLNITMEEIAQKATGIPGRPHFAEVMIEKGYAENFQKVFEDWLDVNGRAYVPKQAPAPCDAISILKKSGSSPILAHPLLKQKLRPHLENLVMHMKECGLFGIEAWHSVHTREDEKFIARIGHKFDLAFSGGSDYHGDNKPDIRLGEGKGNLSIKYEVLEKMKLKRKTMGLPA